MCMAQTVQTMSCLCLHGYAAPPTEVNGRTIVEVDGMTFNSNGSGTVENRRLHMLVTTDDITDNQNDFFGWYKSVQMISSKLTAIAL